MVPVKICMESITPTPLDWSIENMLENRDIADFSSSGPTTGVFIKMVSRINRPFSVLNALFKKQN